MPTFMRDDTGARRRKLARGNPQPLPRGKTSRKTPWGYVGAIPGRTDPGKDNR